MTRREAMAVIAAGLFRLRLHASAGVAPAALERIFDRAYNFDFASGRRLADRYVAEYPGDPLGYASRAAVELFGEMRRLGVLESEFFTDSGGRLRKKKLEASGAVREQLFGDTKQAIELAGEILIREPENADARFARCLAYGVETDYAAFIDKKTFETLSRAKESQKYAADLVERHPEYADGYLTTGISEYFIARLPFFIKWFVRLPGVEGKKEKALEQLSFAAEKGRYLGPFAKVLLVVIALREEEKGEARRLLEELSRDYPENILFRKELQKLKNAGA